MYTLRQIVGLLSLVLASAGPSPLWMHHAACHSHPFACGSSVAESAAIACCGHSHVAQADAELSLGEAVATIGNHQTEHDCFVCYRLSQSASASGCLPASVAIHVTSSAGVSDRVVYPVELSGLFAPRGPPAA